MNLLIYSLGVFALAFAAHVAVWLVRVPAKPFHCMLALFPSVWLLAAVVVRFLPEGLAHLRPEGFWAWFAAGVFHGACSLAYMVVYSALEQDSPSVTMVKFTDLAGSGGRAPDEYSQVLSDEVIVGSRLGAMLAGGMAERRGGRIHLAPKGAFWERLFGGWTRLLGIRGGG